MSITAKYREIRLIRDRFYAALPATNKKTERLSPPPVGYNEVT
jgi:hypothetical protein